MSFVSSLAERLKLISDEINASAQRVGRKASEVRLIAVSKTVPSERVMEAYNLGLREFGENRVQELLEKKKQLPEDIIWHMIGHLQTNKVKQVLGEVSFIHSLDREELAREIEKQAERKGIQRVSCLVQVNSSGEDSKSGLAPKDVEAFVAYLQTVSVIKICGLMTIGPLTKDTDQIRQSFRLMKNLRENLQEKFLSCDWSLLSMGMSEDFKIAIEEESSLVRIGSALFGARN